MENLNMKERERDHFELGNILWIAAKKKNPKDIFEMGSRKSR